MAEKKGLGRGYASLMGMNEVDLEESIASKKSNDLSELPNEIDLSEIDPNYEQPRKNFDEESLIELADSIKQHGVIQPIILTKMGKRYMIIAGERRFRAAKMAGLSTIPAIIRYYTPQQIREISLVENLQRDDLNPVEAAKAIKELMTGYNLTQEAVADRLGKSRPAIANTLRLLALSEKVLKLVEEGRLSAGHARALVVVAEEKNQLDLALSACDNKMSVRETEKAVRDILNPPPPKEEKKLLPLSLELKELVGNMQRVLATKVTAVGNDNKGRLHIDYYTKDDLDRISALVEEWLKKRS